MTESVGGWHSQARKPPSIDLAPIALIADDERTLLELYREVLEGDGFCVLPATNGQEALALAQTWIPDVVVTDVIMPRLDGFGLIRSLRCLYPGVPVIVATGDLHYDSCPLEEVAASHGVAAILRKPFDLDDLLQEVRSVLPLLGPPSLRPRVSTAVARNSDSSDSVRRAVPSSAARPLF
jgi:CheY-like chemotaxis protein